MIRRMSGAKLALRVALLAIGLSTWAIGAKGPAGSKKHRVRHRHATFPVFPSDADESKASKTARLNPEECLLELSRRQVQFTKAAPAPGVLIPVRLLGPVGGVLYRTDFPDAQRPRVPFEVLDCRLVVALSEWSATLRAQDIDEVRLFSAWRPPSKTWPEDRIAEGHPGGLAVDLHLFKQSSGRTLDVERAFHGRIGATACLPPRGSSAPSSALRPTRTSSTCSSLRTTTTLIETISTSR